MKLSDFWTETTETQTHPVDREAEELRQIDEWLRVLAYSAIAVGVGVVLAGWFVTR